MIDGRINDPKNFRNWSRGSPARHSLPESGNFFDILGPHSHPHPTPIEVEFCTAKQTQVPVGPAKVDLNRCNESPLWGEKPDFWSVSKFNTGSLPLCGILSPSVNITHYSALASVRKAVCIP